jgi:hypothetical protein
MPLHRATCAVAAGRKNINCGAVLGHTWYCACMRKWSCGGFPARPHNRSRSGGGSSSSVSAAGRLLLPKWLSGAWSCELLTILVVQQRLCRGASAAASRCPGPKGSLCVSGDQQVLFSWIQLSRQSGWYHHGAACSHHTGGGPAAAKG